MKVSRALTTMALLLLSGACTHASTQGGPTPTSSRTPVAQRRLSGVLMISPPMTRSFATSGTVVLAGPASRRIAVGADGRFEATVPPGEYVVTGRSPLYGGGSYTCITTNAKTLAVPAGKSVSTEVWCLEK